MSKLACLAACVTAIGDGVAFAHHSPAAYDLNTQVTIEGTIRQVDWMNPHSYLKVETQDSGGESHLRQIEVAATAMVERAGLTRELLPLGAHVAVLAAPNRDGPDKTMLGLTVTLSDGGVYLLGPRGRPFVTNVAGGDIDARAEADGLAGQWAPSQAVGGEYQRAVEMWPLTDAAREARRTFQVPVFSGCVPPTSPPVLSLSSGMRTIEVGDRTVVIRFDAPGEDTERVVRLDQSGHPEGMEPSLLGHSVGRWDGEALVIDTAGFAAAPLGLAFGIPSGTGKHLVERLSLTEDRRHLQYEFTVEDPEYLSEAASYTTLWDYRPDLTPAGDNCDAQNARRRPGAAPTPSRAPSNPGALPQ